MIILFGLELVTGNFALLPVAYQAKRISAGQLFSNLGWVYVGNLLGGVFYGCLFAATLSVSASPQTTIEPMLAAAAEAKTIRERLDAGAIDYREPWVVCANIEDRLIPVFAWLDRFSMSDLGAGFTPGRYGNSAGFVGRLP